MIDRRAFEIAFVGLKEGEHVFNYELENEFFTDRNLEEAINIKANVNLILDKHTGFMQLKFEVGGTAQSNCDRCGNPVELELWDDFNMVVKIVEDPEVMNNSEEDPDIFYISRGESHIDVANWLYDFVLLSIPTQRMCKTTEEGGKGCNPEVLEKLKEMEERTRKNESNNIWKGLDKFKEN